MPAPTQVKWAVLHRYGGTTDTWIETGTYLGDTTEYLARTAKHVFSIEPEDNLAMRAAKKFSLHNNVTIIHGLSEDHIDNLLDSVEGPVSLWLDGHYSAGITFKGPIDTPIERELDAIARRLYRLDVAAVFIDDVRCFNPQIPDYAAYPHRSSLVRWAENCQLDWTIEHDIFVAMTR